VALSGQPDWTHDSVLVFCPNLAVDHIIEADGILVGEVQHVISGTLSAGGKGLNLARAGRCIGVSTTVVGLVGGRTGALLMSLLAEEDLEVLSPRLACDTRIATIVHDRVGSRTTVLNERGPVISREDWAMLTSFVKSRIRDASALVCTGSLLPGVSDDGYVELIDASRKAEVPALIDASAETLQRCVEARPELVKVNLDEAESALGVCAGWRSPVFRACAAARRLQVMSGGAVAVTISAGAAIVSNESSAFVRAPEVVVRNEVGAGDSFLAGLVAGLRQYGDVLAAVRRAVAIAAASVETLQPGWLDSDRADELEHLIVLESCE
jgi:1-phosphofructokinase family hexose kinase